MANACMLQNYRVATLAQIFLCRIFWGCWRKILRQCDSLDSSVIPTHCLRGMNFPVSALSPSWATIPPSAAQRGAKLPCDVQDNWPIRASSTASTWENIITHKMNKTDVKVKYYLYLTYSWRCRAQKVQIILVIVTRIFFWKYSKDVN